jgi:hypothetical protein
MNVTATSTSTAVVTASLTTGSSVQAHFSGITPPALTALTPVIYLAAGATIQWPVQALVINGTQPLPDTRWSGRVLRAWWPGRLRLQMPLESHLPR